MTSKEALDNIRDYNTEVIHDVGSEYNENPLEEECNIIEKDLEVLEILKPFLKRGLHIEKIDLTKEKNKIYKGYLPKDYNKTYIYKWDYNYSIWDVFRNEETAILLKEWLDGKD